MVHQQKKLSLFEVIRYIIIHIFFDLNNIHINCKERIQEIKIQSLT
jgi:hypothetical protein